jgi:hypothetical protein
MAVTIVSMMPSTANPGPLNAAICFWPATGLQQPLLTQNALKRYHIFNSLRPWIVSQTYLDADVRPVNLLATATFLIVVGFFGLFLTFQSFNPEPTATGR